MKTFTSPNQGQTALTLQHTAGYNPPPGHNADGYTMAEPVRMAKGGRVNYAQGTPMAEPQVVATQTEGANTTENTRPVNKLSFAELRNRLPKEITDDVVQLLANSEEALQDFAYIQTQEDINKFNIKYGVNVILPQQA